MDNANILILIFIIHVYEKYKSTIFFSKGLSLSVLRANNSLDIFRQENVCVTMKCSGLHKAASQSQCKFFVVQVLYL